MHRTVWILILVVLLFGGSVAAADDAADRYGDIPHKNTPRRLQEAWLRFHESRLCQVVDAAFVFDGGGMQIWSRIESDRDFMRFQAQFASLRSLGGVVLYTNRPREVRDSDGGDNPPPSLWQNRELRANLGDRTVLPSVFDEEQISINPSSSDPLLKQRLFIFAEQVLDRNRKIERYALDIYALVRFASDPDIPADIRSKAFSIGLAHAKDLEKNVGKLASDLEQSIPRPARGQARPARPSARETADQSVQEAAKQLFGSTQAAARRVHRFIYPEYYTVEVEELRKPSLLESLRALRQTVLEFQKTLVKASHSV